MSKKVIFCATQDVINLDQTEYSNRWGLGDVLRGVNNVFGICKDLKIDFEISFDRHPLGQFLKPNSHDHVPNEIYFYKFNSSDELKLFIEKATAGVSPVYIFTNGYGKWDHRYKREFREFMQDKLSISSDSESKIIDNLPCAETYSVFHVRLGDQYFSSISVEIPRPVKKFLRIFNNRDFFFLSDSSSLRLFVHHRYDYQISPGVATHSGVSSDAMDMFNNYIEFLLICHAKNVYTYSGYSWVSGFVQAAHFIFGVNVVNLKNMSIGQRIRIYLGSNL